MPVPESPLYLLGMGSHRGRLFPVIDLPGTLASEAQDSRLATGTRWILLTLRREPLAVACDEAVGLREIADSDIGPTPLPPELARFEGLKDTIRGWVEFSEGPVAVVHSDRWWDRLVPRP